MKTNQTPMLFGEALEKDFDFNNPLPLHQKKENKSGVVVNLMEINTGFPVMKT